MEGEAGLYYCGSGTLPQRGGWGWSWHSMGKLRIRLWNKSTSSPRAEGLPTGLGRRASLRSAQPRLLTRDPGPASTRPCSCGCVVAVL